MIPIIIDDHKGTNPAAGVIATNPQTDPLAKPKMENFPPWIDCQNTQVIPAAAAAKFVETHA